MKAMHRRTFLVGAGGVAVALPFLEAMRPKNARAQDAGPRRVIFEFKPNGDQTAERFVSTHPTDFELGDFLSPLESYRDECLFIHRINKNFDRLNSWERPDNHQEGGSSLAPWAFGAGDFPVGGENRTIGYVLGPSADHELGGRVIDSAAGVPYRHLVYRVGDRHNDIWNLSSHAGPEGQKNPVIPETDPFSAYARLFSFLDEKASEAELLHRVKMQQSVLDLVGSQVKDLSKKVSYEDRQRLELHAEALRDLERSLVQGPRSAQCKAVALPSSFDVYDGAEHVQVAETFFKIMTMAFACDLTRVVNFNWSGNTNDRVYRNLGLEEGHHTISHRSDDESFGMIRQIHKHLWQNTTTLYEELLNMPDGAGSLWDNTLVFHWNELGQGDVHSLNDALVVLSGGGSGFFKKGQLIDKDHGGSFTDLLTSCFQYMGFSDVERFGDPRLSNTNSGDPDVRA